ncbi:MULTISPECIES: sulfotransferase family protein [Mycobacteriaceae]|uniref:Sulfotransferase n=1 Tax=Mycolicibacterium neoaurum VKM Ac-1815D TaxID=700508 RepID=V5XIX4_MYCNE|nr:MULTISPECIES: sulfotransferase [Mycobacteriaceae]AHC27434.1 sulfotransferase [Mycolicibacterium neoaurum VKM Ac-1815D]AMO07646.1 sulfotransferase [Mycolicibacterium neoaurum]AXK73966.1 sulfotransferase [Mycolicibacterium neoaurum]KJQ51599.1 sulfotransferase [Mycolicibacterium neoaurum]KUM08823.1 sulfotransferase [Mycolicibacterium neoaurum]
MVDNFAVCSPWPVRTLNRIGRPLAAGGLAPTLQSGSLRSAAGTSAGMDWVADSYLDEALDVLTESLVAEAELSYLGRIMVQKRLVRMLTTRLRMRRLLRSRPEIAERTIAPPVVIVGLQRSGTTLLHRLLAADPATRSMASWEGARPLPDDEQAAHAPDSRRAVAAREERALRYLQPQFYAIHSLESTAPEEDVLLLDYSLHSQMAEVMFHVPSYARWLLQQDMRPAYELHRVMLQILDWQHCRERWVLKSPAHLEHLDALLEALPGAVVVWTHRDPAQTTASSSSMLAHYQSLFSDRVDHRRLARHWLDKNSTMIDRAMQFRRTSKGIFVDVHYHELMADPMSVIGRIYAAQGRPLSDAAAATMTDTLAASPQNLHGEHRYSLRQFGLNVADVDDCYSGYIEHFSIDRERGGVREL